MKYLLDTNQIIDFLNNKQVVVDQLSSMLVEGVSISTISVAEYLQGVFKTKNPAHALELFSKFIDEGKVEVLVVDFKVSETYAKLQANFEQKGNRIPLFDLLIAATTITHGLILVSDDKVFTRIKDLGLLS